MFDRGVFNEYTWKGLFHIIVRDCKDTFNLIVRNRYLVLMLFCLAKLILQIFSVSTIATVVCLVYASK